MITFEISFPHILQALAIIFTAVVICSVIITFQRGRQVDKIWKAWLAHLRLNIETLSRQPLSQGEAVSMLCMGGLVREAIIIKFLPHWRDDLPEWVSVRRRIILAQDLYNSVEVVLIKDLLITSCQFYPSRDRRRTDALEEDYFKRNPL